ncbi:hypothetical protein [Bradyrhizobium sp.]|nr:hypothetical protein [Bradyrhizobium sp.]
MRANGSYGLAKVQLSFEMGGYHAVEAVQDGRIFIELMRRIVG